MKKLFSYAFLLLAGMLMLNACGSGESTTTENETTESTETTETTETSGPLSWEKDGLTVTELENVQEYPDATIDVVDIENDANFEPGTMTYKFALENYELGIATPDQDAQGLAASGKGQHVHVILNNQPYMAHYTPEFDLEMEEGNYFLVAFPARSYHLSVKNGNSVTTRRFSVGSPEGEPVDLDAAHLVYSRPKGTYTGDDCKKLLLDFYLLNTDLAEDGNKVKATINGTEFLLPKWAPYVVEGLPYGEVTIKLELLDAEGNMIEGPYNSVERTVTLQETAPEE